MVKTLIVKCQYCEEEMEIYMDLDDFILSEDTDFWCPECDEKAFIDGRGLNFPDYTKNSN